MNKKDFCDERLFPEEVWGLEAMDLLEQSEQVCSFWQQKRDKSAASQPLLFLYAPSAERMALRYLHSFARIGRSTESGMAVFFSTHSQRPYLQFEPASKAGLYVIHQPGRYLNIDDFLKVARMNTDVRVVMAAPASEAHALAVYDACQIEWVRSEEDAYCEKRSHELVAKFLKLPGYADPHLDLILQILAEAGIADIELPVSLLADYLCLDTAKIRNILESELMQKFVLLREQSVSGKSLVAFRGRWLAETVAIRAHSGYYPYLFGLVEFVDPRESSHRLFLLNLLIGLRAQIPYKVFMRFHTFYDQKIHDCLKEATLEEQEWWHLATQGIISKKVHSLARSAEEQFRNLVTGKNRGASILILSTLCVFLNKRRKHSTASANRSNVESA